MQNDKEEALRKLKEFSGDKNKLCAQWSASKCSEAEKLIDEVGSFGFNVQELLDVCNEAKKNVKGGERNRFAPNNTSRKYVLNEAGVTAFKGAVDHLAQVDSPPRRARDPGMDTGAGLNSAGPSPAKPTRGSGSGAPTQAQRRFHFSDISEDETEDGTPLPPGVAPVFIPAEVCVALKECHRVAVIKTDIRFEPPNGSAYPPTALTLEDRFKKKVYDVAHRVCEFYNGDPRFCNITRTAAYELFLKSTDDEATCDAVRKEVLQRWFAELNAYAPAPGPTLAQRNGCFFFLHLTVSVNRETEITAHQMKMF